MAAPISGPGGSSSAPPSSAVVVPAQLGFLAIYNPSLGTTDETMEDQIVYYSSVVSPSSSPSRKQRRTSTGAAEEQHSSSKDDRNERLRQIGLAQGMVEFGRSFSGDRPVDTVETEKSRVVLHELEPGWWILASVDLTRLPVVAAAKGNGKAAGGKEREGEQQQQQQEVEYSSREVKPAALLLQDLLRAHSVFLLHHGSSLSELFVRTRRPRFTSAVSRFWDIFLASWNVMMHGNPLRNIFGGIKIAACGELGFGVGEEERGSGEREVLEGLVGRIDGLVDLVVGKFGEADETADGKVKSGGGGVASQWLGTGDEPGAEDGAIFLGVGALSRHSLRDVTFWMEDLYTWGENAYGVKESPSARRSHFRRKKPASKSTASPAAPPAQAPDIRAPDIRVQSPESGSGQTGFGPPPPIVKPAAPRSAGSKNAPATDQDDKDAGGMDKMMGYLKLGYGTYWSLGSTPGPGEETAEPTPTSEVNTPPARPSASRNNSQDDAAGHYLIGLKGNVEENASADDNPEEGSRTLLRTLTVELESEGIDKSESQTSHDLGSNDTELAPQPMKNTKSPASSNHTVTARSSQNNSQNNSDNADASTRSKDNGNSSQTSRGDKDDYPHGDGAQNQQTTFDSQDRNKTKRMRVVVYVNKPFIFVFLFSLHTDSLNYDATYRTLHHELSPLRRPLLASTAYRPDRQGVAGGGQKIYDLVWDPKSLTVHSTIPNIPAINSMGEGDGEIWNRVEALNTHVQLLNTHASTRGPGKEVELERTAKTSRGWWIVWSRILEREEAAGRGGRGGGSASGSLREMDEEEEEGERSRASQGGDGTSGRGSSGSTDDEATPTQDGDAVVGKEIFLIRKSGEQGGGGGGGGVRSYISVGGGGSGGGWADGASRLAQGIGVDTRKYIEGLLSLNR